MNPSQFTPFK